ncbi:hypothetical protein BC629DRAFT_1463460 [Irpex lacteus]|nr:hypothetical protein BC629DRAFT_1463460 [Irpex lacteus]
MAKQPRDDTSSTALIIDFDRAAVANPNNPMTATLQYSKEILTRRTGTPGYRARSVATTSVARRFRFCPMPKLGEQARELYINAYGQASHDHGRISLNNTPADTQEVLRSKAFRLGQCLEHFQQSNNAKDFRDELLRKTAEEWKTVLPTRLQSTIPLIVQLGRQPAPGHLHEAFRRILLNFIVKINDPIPLLPGVRRSVHLEPTTVAATEIMLPQDVASGAIIPIANPAATRVAHTKSARNPALSPNEVLALFKIFRAETSAIPGLPTSATSTRKRTREPGYADYTEDIQGLMKACGLESDTEGEENASSSPGKKRRCM